MNWSDLFRRIFIPKIETMPEEELSNQKSKFTDTQLKG